MKDQTEVCNPFGRGHVPDRYPRRYSAAFAFSVLLYPQPQQRSLRSACPLKGGITGLPSSVSITQKVKALPIRRWLNDDVPRM